MKVAGVRIHNSPGIVNSWPLALRDSPGYFEYIGSDEVLLQLRTLYERWRMVLQKIRVSQNFSRFS